MSKKKEEFIRQYEIKRLSVDDGFGGYIKLDFDPHEKFINLSIDHSNDEDELISVRLADLDEFIEDLIDIRKVIKAIEKRNE